MFGEHFHIYNELWKMTFFVTKQGAFVMYGDKARAISFTS